VAVARRRHLAAVPHAQPQQAFDRQLGIRHFDASLGGIGGCPFAPGDIATDDLVNLLHHAGIDVDRLVEVRDQLHTLLGRRLDSALAAAKATLAKLRPL
jgi:hydroxymethylglutaryl-CoA lyase